MRKVKVRVEERKVKVKNPHFSKSQCRINIWLCKDIKLDSYEKVLVIGISSRGLHAVFKEMVLHHSWHHIHAPLWISVNSSPIPEEELDDILVGIVLRVVESGVSAGVDAVDDGLHAMLDQHVVVAQQRVDRLLVHVAALVPVHQDLVVVASLQHHVEDRLVELVLDQEVCVKEPLEHIH